MIVTRLVIKMFHINARFPRPRTVEFSDPLKISSFLHVPHSTLDLNIPHFPSPRSSSSQPFLSHCPLPFLFFLPIPCSNSFCSFYPNTLPSNLPSTPPLSLHLPCTSPVPSTFSLLYIFLKLCFLNHRPVLPFPLPLSSPPLPNPSFCLFSPHSSSCPARLLLLHLLLLIPLNLFLRLSFLFPSGSSPFPTTRKNF